MIYFTAEGAEVLAEQTQRLFLPTRLCENLRRPLRLELSQLPFTLSVSNTRGALKLESESDLSFSSRQHLRFGSEGAGRSQRAEDCGRILAVQQIEELK